MGDRLVFSVDPGEKNIGIALFRYSEESRKADMKFMQVVDLAGFHKSLKAIQNSTAVVQLEIACENFRIDPNNYAGRSRGKSSLAFQWSEVETARVIGALQYVAAITNSRLTLQEPGILNMARKWAPFPVPKGHIPDDKSAALHGMYYMREQRYIHGVSQVTLYGQEVIG